MPNILTEEDVYHSNVKELIHLLQLCIVDDRYWTNVMAKIDALEVWVKMAKTNRLYI